MLPLWAIGAIMTAGSTLANTVAARQQQAARDDAMAAERIRQRGLDREAQAANTRAQDRFQGAEGQTQERGAALGEMFVAPPDAGVANASAGTALPSATNDIVTREIANRSAGARAFTDQQGRALANLRAFGDLLGDLNRDTARDASEIAQIGGFKSGSSNILPLELEQAMQAGSGARLLGDILGGVGGITLTAGLQRGPQTAGAVGLRPPPPRPVRLPA